jgi:hypothetical protein
MKTSIRKIAGPASIVGLAALGCVAAATHLAQTRPPRLPAPPPLPFPDERALASFSHVQGYAGSTTTSVVLVQVVATDPPNAKAVRVKPLREGDLPAVKGARLALVETLSGPPVPPVLTLTNPPPENPRSLFGHGDHTVTRRMRVGEYWLLPYTPSTGKFDLYGFPGNARLRGLDDPAIPLFRRHLRWVTSRNPMMAFNEIKRIVLSSKEPLYSRVSAYGAIWDLPDELHRRRDPRAPLYAAAQRLVVEMLRQPELPKDLRQFALNTMEVDPTRPLTRGSDEEFKLRYLLRLLFDGDDQTAAKAAERLYFMNIKSGSENGRSVVYYFPDIIEALEMREAQDRAKGRRSIATGALGNLQLVNRRSLAAMQKEQAVVIRRLP